MQPGPTHDRVRIVTRAFLGGVIMIGVMLATAGAGPEPASAAVRHHARPASGPPSSGAHELEAYAVGAVALEAALAAALDSANVPRAVSLADSAMALREHRYGTTPLGVAAYLDSVALRFFALSNAQGWSAAERCFERSLEIKRRALGPRDLKVALTLFALATINDYQGQWDKAAQHSEQALEIRTARLGRKDPVVASSLRQLGMLRFQLGQYAEAESLVTRSMRIYQSASGDFTEKIASNLNNLGDISRVQDHYDDAERQFRRGLELCKDKLAEDAPLRVALMNNLAGLYRDLARYSDAEPLLEESLRLRQNSPLSSPEAIATATLNLAEIYRLQGRNDEAAPLYARALDIARPALGPGNPSLAPFVNQAAVSLEESGRLSEAEPLFREALASTERSLGRDHPLVAQSLEDLGRLLEHRGAYAEAESTYRRARDIRSARLGAGHPDVAVSRVELARCLAADPRQGDAAAAPELEPAFGVLDSTGTYPEAALEAHALRAAMSERAGRTTEAISDLSAALDRLDSLRAWRGGGDATRAAFVARHLDLYDRMVELRLAAGDADRALEAHERGRARLMRDQLAASGVDLRAGIPAAELEPLVQQEEMARRALARVQRAIETLDADQELPLAQRLERQSALEARRDSAARVLARSGEAIKDKSPIWRQLLTRDGRPASRVEIQHALRKGELLLEYHLGSDGGWAFVVEPDGKPARAFPLAADSESAKDLDYTADRAAGGDPDLVASNATTGDGATRAAAAAGANDSGTRASDSKSDRRKSSSRRSGDRLKPSEAGVQSISAAALERAIAGDTTRARALAAPGIAELLSGARSAGGAVAELPGASDATLDRKLAALSHVLLPEPLWSRVRRARSVIIVPDGALHLLPFEALALAPRTAKRDARYWLDEGPPVRYAASATSLMRLESRAAERPRPEARVAALSVSDPELSRSSAAGWAALPGTRRETEAIREAFAPRPIEALQGPMASESAVRAALPGQRIVHLATHGFVTERRGDVLAGLVLAADSTRAEATDSDGLLQLFEIYGLRLDCDLAVLSACETARGPRVAGEGVFALSRGFLTAGANRVVASLWPVEDASTAKLMGTLFRDAAGAERRKRDVDWATALRDAKLSIRSQRESAAPFYWAPFVLTGVR